MKPIRDIRVYSGGFVPEKYCPSGFVPSREPESIEIPKSLNRDAARVASFLGSAGLSLGGFDHLYINLTHHFPPGESAATEFGEEPWIRRGIYGVARSFNTLPETERRRQGWEAIFDVLRCFAPDSNKMLVDAKQQLEAKGERIRIPWLRKENKSATVTVYHDIPALDERPYMYLQVQDTKRGVSLESQPVPLEHHDDVKAIAGRVSYKDRMVTLHPRSSNWAKWRLGFYKEINGVLQVPVDG